MIVLLFAEIQGGPKTKQAASDSGAALGQDRGRLCDLKQSILVARVRWWPPDGDASTLSSAVCVDVKKNKPEEAPASRDSGSRRSYSGKPATKSRPLPSSRDQRGSRSRLSGNEAGKSRVREN